MRVLAVPGASAGLVPGVARLFLMVPVYYPLQASLSLVMAGPVAPAETADTCLKQLARM